MNEPDTREILRRCRLFAVVGLSPKPERDSHRVARFLQARGYRIIPVYPREAEILGEKFQSLRVRNVTADPGVDRERHLLYSIINSVTDPNLLTDELVKLIIRNLRARGRTLIAILENHQRADGTVEIPEHLWQYLPERARVLAPTG